MRAHRRAMIRHTKHAEEVSGIRVEQMPYAGGLTEIAVELSFADGATMRLVMSESEAEALRHRLFALGMRD